MRRDFSQGRVIVNFYGGCEGSKYCVFNDLYCCITACKLSDKTSFQITLLTKTAVKITCDLEKGLELTVILILRTIIFSD